MASVQLCRECGAACDTDSCIFENYAHSTHPNTKTIGHQVRTKNMPCSIHQKQCKDTPCYKEQMCTEDNPCYAQQAVHKTFVRLENHRQAIANMNKGFVKFVDSRPIGTKNRSVYLKFLNVVLSIVDHGIIPQILTDLEKITLMNLCVSFKETKPISNTLDENAGYYGIEVLQKIRDILMENVREVLKTQPENDMLETMKKATTLTPDHLHQLLQMDDTLDTRRLVDMIRFVNYTVWYTNFSSIYPKVKCYGCKSRKREKLPCRGICSVTNTLTPNGRANIVMTTCGRTVKSPDIFCECHCMQSLDKQKTKKKLDPYQISDWKIFAWKSVQPDGKHMYREGSLMGCLNSCTIFELDTPLWSELRLRYCTKHDYHLMNMGDRTMYGPVLKRSKKDQTITEMNFSVRI